MKKYITAMRATIIIILSIVQGSPSVLKSECIYYIKADTICKPFLKKAVCNFISVV